MEEGVNQQKESVPEPPAPEIIIRTMESDIKALEEGGGEIINPRPFTPPAVNKEEPKIEAELNVPGYTGPEKAIFTSAEFSPVAPAPAEPAAAESAAAESAPRRFSSWKVVAVIIGILALIAGLGLLGYFVIFPWIFPGEMPAVQ